MSDPVFGPIFGRATGPGSNIPTHLPGGQLQGSSPSGSGGSSGGGSCGGGGGGGSVCGGDSSGWLPTPQGGGGGGNQPGFFCCIDPDTPVTLSDGQRRLASQIGEGDLLLGLGDSGCPTAQTVLSVIRGREKCRQIGYEGGELVCSESHLLCHLGGSWVRAVELTVGDFLLGETGDGVKILGIEELEEQDVLTFACEPNHNFFASGVLNHNKYKTIPPEWQ